MLHRHHGWLFELANTAQGLIGIFNVVIGELFAVQLLSAQDRVTFRDGILVKPGLLVGVFTVTHLLLQVPGQS